MPDWDASESEEDKPKVPAVPPKPLAKKWADEDEEDKEVASDWEESDESEDEKPARPAAAAPPVKKKATVKQKILEKAAAKEVKLANGEESDTEDDLLDPSVKRRLDRERELQADLSNAEDLLGAGRPPVSTSKELNGLLTANPKTKEEFSALSKQIIDTIFKRLENKPLYATFIEGHIKELARPLRDVDIRKTASQLTALANEKQKEAKEGGKKKKALKPALGSVKATKADTKIYDEPLDDFGQDPDDFM